MFLWSEGKDTARFDIPLQRLRKNPEVLPKIAKNIPRGLKAA